MIEKYLQASMFGLLSHVSVTPKKEAKSRSFRVFKFGVSDRGYRHEHIVDVALESRHSALTITDWSFVDPMAQDLVATMTT